MASVNFEKIPVPNKRAKPKPGSGFDEKNLNLAGSGSAARPNSLDSFQHKISAENCLSVENLMTDTVSNDGKQSHSPTFAICQIRMELLYYFNKELSLQIKSMDTVLIP